MLNRYPWVNVALRYGLITGVLGMILWVGLYFIGRHPFLIPVYMDFRIILFGVLLFFGLKEFRDFYQKGELYFWQGMAISLLLTIIFSLIAFFTIWGFATWRAGFLPEYIKLTTEQLKTLPPEIIERIGKPVYERNLEILPATRPVDLAVLYVSQSFQISLFVSIIISVILRRQPKIN